MTASSSATPDPRPTDDNTTAVPAGATRSAGARSQLRRFFSTPRRTRATAVSLAGLALFGVLGYGGVTSASWMQDAGLGSVTLSSGDLGIYQNSSTCASFKPSIVRASGTSAGSVVVGAGETFKIVQPISLKMRGDNLRVELRGAAVNSSGDDVAPSSNWITTYHIEKADGSSFSTAASAEHPINSWTPSSELSLSASMLSSYSASTGAADADCVADARVVFTITAPAQDAASNSSSLPFKTAVFARQTR